MPLLICEDDEVVYGDTGYTGLAKRAEIQADPHLARIEYRTNTRNRFHWKTQAPGFDWDRYMEYLKSRVRSKFDQYLPRASLLAAYNRLDDKGKARVAAYVDALSARASLREAPNGAHAPREIVRSILAYETR